MESHRTRDSSRRAVEAYWRSKMVDGVTSDEVKVAPIYKLEEIFDLLRTSHMVDGVTSDEVKFAPVYKLEEICDLLRTSHVSIVKEVSDYILKRIDHKNPVVKQKVMYSDLKMSHTKAQVRAGCKVTERKVVVCPRSSSHQFAKMSIIALIINATPPHSSPQFSEFWHRLGSGRNFIEEVSNDKGFNIRTTIVSRLESVKWRLRESSSSSLQEGKKAEPHDLKDDPLFLEEELRNVHIGVGCDTCGLI
ncbi:uncharacterized protein A4U43_C01F28550 [Asparagus officinalis]|uniref:VHS domain-containing protein n=1 Tax=Asparagus officinalis TaxID=4686 RepID=A0A5P1FW09_ASPOF|nr:uncharacterized protein A4U43_C01F28550 [Asparagus officinalis]